MSDFGNVIGILFFVALLPGFVAAKVRDWVTERSISGATGSDVVRALIYWIPIIFVLWAFSKTLAPALTPLPFGEEFEPSTILAALIIAVPIGLLAGVLGETRVAQRIAFRYGISRKSWKTPWASAFWDAENELERPCWAMVWLKDGTRFLGFVRYYSDSGENPTIYLARQEKYDQGVSMYHPGSDVAVDIPGIGVLIPPSAQITHVDFLPGCSVSGDSGIAGEAQA